MIFIQFPFNPKPNSGKQNSDFFFYIFFVWFWRMFDLQHYVNPCYTK